MLNAHLVKTDAETARDTALTARMNVYYHERRKAYWGKRESIGKVLVAGLSAIGSAPVAGAPFWLGYAAVLAAIVGTLLIAFRLDRKVETHATLAARYVIHAQDFERMMRTGNYDDVVRIVESFEQTERIESELEGEPDHIEIKRARERLIEQIGLNNAPTVAASAL